MKESINTNLCEMLDRSYPMFEDNLKDNDNFLKENTINHDITRILKNRTALEVVEKVRSDTKKEVTNRFILSKEAGNIRMEKRSLNDEPKQLYMQEKEEKEVETLNNKENWTPKISKGSFLNGRAFDPQKTSTDSGRYPKTIPVFRFAGWQSTGRCPQICLIIFNQ